MMIVRRLTATKKTGFMTHDKEQEYGMDTSLNPFEFYFSVGFRSLDTQ
jgi:hypothetical protein